MKKLMIVACAVAMSAIAQAGAVKWSATFLDASTAAGYTASTTYTAYLFDASTYDVGGITAYLTKESGADLTSFTAAAADVNTATYDTTKEAMNFGAKAYGTFTQGDTFSGFMVVLDSSTAAGAKNFLVAEKDSENVLTTAAFGKTGDKSMSFGSQEGVAWTAISSVPEPTSGLLLLLGMAGLALRRRRA